MKAYKDFIVHIPQRFNDTFKTENGVEIYADRQFSPKLVANTIITVVETPMNYEGPIAKGDTLFIDPTVVFSQLYQNTGEQESQYLIDREKKLYKVDPSLLIAYRKREESWVGFGNNVLVERLKEVAEGSAFLYAPGATVKPSEDRGEVRVTNPDSSVKEGDVILFDPSFAVDIKMGNESLVWLREKDCLALVKESYE